jgi:hypothetical protein
MSQKLLYDGTFWLSITTILNASIAVVIRACYKSKCSDFQCCYSLIKIERDTAVEEHIDIERGVSRRRDSIPERD